MNILIRSLKLAAVHNCVGGQVQFPLIKRQMFACLSLPFYGDSQRLYFSSKFGFKNAKIATYLFNKYIIRILAGQYVVGAE